jgi:ketosteroid isomerase-like protein
MGRNKAIVKNLYDALARSDASTVLGTLDPAIQWREADNFLYADGNPYVGPHAVAEGVIQRLGSDIENFAVIPANLIDGGDTIVAEGRYRGKVKVTGKMVDAQFAHVWELRNEKVVRFQQYTDTKQWGEAARS